MFPLKGTDGKVIHLNPRHIVSAEPFEIRERNGSMVQAVRVVMTQPLGANTYVVRVKNADAVVGAIAMAVRDLINY